VVTKPLRPSGWVSIGHDMHDVISDGEFIDKGRLVVITEIHANRIMVTLKTSEVSGSLKYK